MLRLPLGHQLPGPGGSLREVGQAGIAEPVPGDVRELGIAVLLEAEDQTILRPRQNVIALIVLPLDEVELYVRVLEDLEPGEMPAELADLPELNRRNDRADRLGTARSIWPPAP